MYNSVAVRDFSEVMRDAGVRSIAISLSACMSVGSLAYLNKPHVQISRIFLHVLPVAVARCFRDDNMQYVMYFRF